MEITPNINAKDARLDSEKIREQAKKIMDEFMTALDKAENNNLAFGEERQASTRAKMSKQGTENSFRELMFDNAPKKNDEYIIAEKKKW